MLIFLGVVIILSVLDIIELKSKGKPKEIFVYIGLMLLAVAFGVWHFTSTYQDSIAEHIFEILNVKG